MFIFLNSTSTELWLTQTFVCQYTTTTTTTNTIIIIIIIIIIYTTTTIIISSSSTTTTTTTTRLSNPVTGPVVAQRGIEL
jgi:hypothetical protein